MLLGEDIGGRHEGNLVTVLDGLQRSERGNNGLAAADIAEQQALHRVRLREIAADFSTYLLLRASQRERQVFYQLRSEPVLRRKFGRDAPAALAVMHAHRQLLRQQLVEFDAPPRGMAALLQAACGNVRRRVVQQSETAGKVCQPQLFQQRFRQRIAQRQRLQRVTDQLAQHRLRQPGGSRIHRREALLQRCVVAHRAALRMHHLQPVIPHTHLADGADLPACCELLLLAGIEIQEAQIQFAAVVLQAANQSAARAEGHFAVGDNALHLHGFAGLRGGNRRKMRLILIAQRQMQQQIGAMANAQLGEFAENGRRYLGRLHGLAMHLT